MGHHHAWDDAEAATIVNAHAHLDGPLLPILHALQEHFGYVDRAVVPTIADTLNLSKAEVVGVISFYHDFKTAPQPRRVIKLCRAEACQSVGCEDLVQHLKERHGLDADHADHHALGPIAVDTVYCLGNCALGPAALVNGNPVGRLDADRLDAIIAEGQAQ